MLVRALRRVDLASRLPMFLWEVLVALVVAQAVANTLLGRTLPHHATRTWILAVAVISCTVLAWLVSVSERAHPGLRHRHGKPFLALALTQLPLLALSLILSLVVYASDYWHHRFITLLHPMPAVLLLLCILATAVAQEIVLREGARGVRRAVLPTLVSCRRWAVPTSLLLLGFLQGSSYLWAIGNDFTRYWAIADALGSMAGYPVSHHQPVYVAAGMHPISIELPFFPILLLASFTLFGHDTVGAQMPGLLANILLPLLLYVFYRRAGLGRPLAFAASCLVVTLPFFRLYTLNAPVPDAVFEALLVGTGCIFLRLVGGWNRRSGKVGRRQPWALWLLFGLLAGLTTLTRPEGLLFVALMFVALTPNLFQRRFYVASAMFVAPLLPFVLVMMSTFGLLWPRNQGTSSALGNITKNLDWLGRYSLRWFAEPLEVSPAAFTALVAALLLIVIAGTLWMVTRHWQAAVLPLSALLHLGLVFTIDPRASGADQWFDFFRHASYCLPFAMLAVLFLAEQLLRGTYRSQFFSRQGESLRRWPVYVFAILVLLVSMYQIRLLAFPSASYGSLGRQFLTSDAWVSLPDIVSSPYRLPVLSFVQRGEVLTFDPESVYLSRHRRSVTNHFEPISSLVTGRGTGYQLSSLLVVLFGTVFAFVGASGSFRKKRQNRRIGGAGVGR